MINEEEFDTFYYLYRHIRLDTNVPFYIGIGTYKSTSKYKNKYNRAFTHNKRNQYWKNVVNLTEYKVEIIFKSDNRDIICEKEKEFIKLYGRKEFGGTLTNLTDGGDFCIMSKEVSAKSVATKRKNGVYEKVAKINSIKMKGNKNSLGAKHPNQYQKIFLYNTSGELCYKFDSIKECYIAKSNRIHDAILNNKFYKGYKFFYTYLGDVITQEQLLQQTETLKKNPKKSTITGQEKPVDVYRYDTLEYIGQYISISEACRNINLKYTPHTSSVANGKRAHVNGYIFKFTYDTTSIEDFKKVSTYSVSEETKEKHRNSTNRKKIEVYDYETCKFIAEYDSIEESCRKIDGGLLANKVSAVAKKKQRHHKGYIFKFATDTTPIEEFKNKK